MRIITIAGGVIWLTLGVAGAARAQEALVLSLDAAVARGMAEAPKLAEARAREVAAGAVVTARSALQRPVVTAVTGALRTNHVEPFGVPLAGGGVREIFPDIPTNVRARAEVTMPIFTAGRIQELVAAARSERQATAADRDLAAADMTLDVITAYYSLLLTRERVAVLVRALERADASLDTVRARVDAGVLPPNESLSADARRARQNVQLIQARNDAALAEAVLARFVAAEPGRSIVLSTPVDQPVSGVGEVAALSIEALMERARAGRPERQAIAARHAARRAAADAALSATRPQVSVLAAVEPARPNARFVPRADEWNTGWDLGVNATWTLWDGGRSRAEHAAAMAEADALNHRMADFDQMLAVEVRQRLLDIAAAHAALAASNDAVTAASEARRVVGERFLVGVVTHTDVLDADLDWLDAELEHTRLGVALRLSEARLLRTAGGQ